MTPRLIYDGDCAFCAEWVERWRAQTGNRIVYVPFQRLSEKIPGIDPAALKEAVHFVDRNGTVTRGAEAVFILLRDGAGRATLFHLYQRLFLFRKASEWFYRWTADHRETAAQVWNLLKRVSLSSSHFSLSTDLFIRLLALIYFIAFVSLGTQVLGLYGSQGILPASVYLEHVADKLGGIRYFFVPTVFWMNSADLSLQAFCWVGAGCSLLLLAGILPVLMLSILWFLYLSYVSIGQVFLWYQWDVLLLEAGFLSIFLAHPADLVLRRREPSRLILLLMWWLLFRLILSSGIVKVLSLDISWRTLTALNYHYFTQPIPAWSSWYFHLLPAWFDRFSALLMFFIELIVPFFIFSPRSMRHKAALFIIALQLFILLSGNFAFFNLLAIALCLLLFDGTFWPLKKMRSQQPLQKGRRGWPLAFLSALFAFVFMLSWGPFSTVIPGMEAPRPIRYLNHILSGWNFSNAYGLFAVMTRTRPEIIIEGSNDKSEWKPYDFRFKPDDPQEAPPFVAPHQPRLDWQMWFAALNPVDREPWILALCHRLLQGSQPVLHLLREQPFKEGPPKWVRAVLYDYRFTTIEERRETGAWWKREVVGTYLPELSLDQFKRLGP